MFGQELSSAAFKQGRGKLCAKFLWLTAGTRHSFADQCIAIWMCHQSVNSYLIVCNNGVRSYWQLTSASETTKQRTLCRTSQTRWQMISRHCDLLRKVIGLPRLDADCALADRGQHFFG